ncbi:MAG: Holliday junction branch migration protein RuvA [Candidatus Marinimicrobia bacterium]|nr:Holliday junction branch migration protein RuvA [Candidatus Neomarinimicrobiota bacterium]
MISHIRGTLVQKQPLLVIVDVGGLGYSINIPLSTFEKLPDKDSSVELFTHLHVREDEMSLYGFQTEDERKMFRLLIGISGIGPKVAIGILSGTGIPQLRKAVTEGDVDRLTTIKGIGKKTAQRLIVELRDKLGAPEDGDEWLRSEGEEPEVEENLLSAAYALETLGYSSKQAFAAAKKSLKTLGNDAEPEQLIKEALGKVG